MKKIRLSKLGLPSFNIFGLDIVQLSLLYNMVHGHLSDEELEEMIKIIEEKERGD